MSSELGSENGENLIQAKISSFTACQNLKGWRQAPIQTLTIFTSQLPPIRIAFVVFLDIMVIVFTLLDATNTCTVKSVVIMQPFMYIQGWYYKSPGQRLLVAKHFHSSPQDGLVVSTMLTGSMNIYSSQWCSLFIPWGPACSTFTFHLNNTLP